MKRIFYLKLACQNIRKNAKSYIPYILMNLFITAMYYVIYALCINDGMKDMHGGAQMQSMLGTGAGIVAFCALLFIFYINSFLMKRRKKEFGLYTILGMEKRHLTEVVFWENTVVAVGSIAAGIGFGLLMNKLVYLGVVNILEVDIPLGFEIALPAVWKTVQWFGIIHALIFLNGVRQVCTVRPIELLQAGKTGEREPKAKLLIALLGLLFLAAGYYLAVTTTNPMAALLVIFVAIIFVMIGTYLTFTAGSIAFLKLLRKNKGYYYQTRHFISVSGMLYRMKQNAMGLANIAILSTGILLLVSTTLSLYLDAKNIMEKRYPRDVMVTVREQEQGQEEAVLETIGGAAAEQGVVLSDSYHYRYAAITATVEGTVLQTAYVNGYADPFMEHAYGIYLMTLEDYNRSCGTQEVLEDGEILLYLNRENSYQSDALSILGKDYRITKRVEEFVEDDNMTTNILSTMVLILKDDAEMEELCALQRQADENNLSITGIYGMNLDGGEEKLQEFTAALNGHMEAFPQTIWVEDRETGKSDFLGVYGGMFFIGIFLSVLFLVATVLIIYYKQISEGYDDRERFEIMQKVGMDKRGIRRAINSQVLTVFFLPLVTAGIHTAFAFPIMRRLLLMLQLTNTRLYITVTVVGFLIFAVFYAMIYKLTARVYYRIVS